MQRHLQTCRQNVEQRQTQIYSLPLYKIQQRAKLDNGVSSQHCGYLWGKGRVLEKGAQGRLLGC